MPCPQEPKYQWKLDRCSATFEGDSFDFLELAFPSCPVALMLVPKQRCLRAELVAKHYYLDAPVVVAEQIVAAGNTALVDPFPFVGELAMAAASLRASSVVVLGEVLGFAGPSAYAYQDDEEAEVAEVGTFPEPYPFHRLHSSAFWNHGVKSFAWNHDDVENDPWNGCDFDVVHIRN